MFHVTATGSIVRCYHVPVRCDRAPVEDHFMTVRDARRSLKLDELDFQVDRLCVPAGWGVFLLEEPAPAAMSNSVDTLLLTEDLSMFEPF